MVGSTQQGNAKPGKFTDSTIKSLMPSNGRREYPVPDCRGLYVVVQPTGRRSLAVRFRVNGKPKKLTLPKGITLAKARIEAATALLKARHGEDPTVAKKKDREAQRTAVENTFKAVAESYLTHEGKKPEDKRLRSLEWRRQLLERLVYPTLGEQPICTIKRRAVIDLLDKIEHGALRHPETKEPIKGGATMAHSTLAVMRAIMNWHQVRDVEFRSPIVRGMGRIKPNDHKRERVLGDEELRAVWTTAEERATDPFAALIRFLLLTAARRNEAARLPRDEVEDGDWTLPARRNKVKLDLIRPLSKAAQRLLDARPEIDGCLFYFTSGKKPLAAFSQLKDEFDEACGVSAWRLHDLRRTSRTLMSRAGVKPEHAEECLGRVKPGVKGTYDRHKFYKEKKQAYEALAAQIERIVHPH
jgi:integrase